MNNLALIILISISVVYGWNDGVIKFSAEDKFELEKLKLKELLFGNALNNPFRKVRLGAFSYKNCGNPSTDLLVISDLTLGPDPLSFPGDLSVSFKAVIKSDIDAPLGANLLLQKKLGSGYIKIPCIGIIGSCKYDDLCDILSGATCPPPFAAKGIPCKCPFNKGAYALPTAKFSVDAAVFPPGDYRAQANLTYNAKPVACVDLTATIV